MIKQVADAATTSCTAPPARSRIDDPPGHRMRLEVRRSGGGLEIAGTPASIVGASFSSMPHTESS